ncbi:MAG: amidohydrolase family protein [Bryobacteraceae bacterium]
MILSRRALLLSAAVNDPNPIDTHIHLFEPKRFPYHPAATYQPPAETLDNYGPFAAKVLSHCIIVHPEPYQDDHRYLEYCFQNEPRKGFFKGTCLFDAFDPQTPARMAALCRKWPNRIVALRVHATKKQTEAGGAIRDRDLADPRMAQTWAAAAKLGLAIQMHMIPMWAPAVGKLVARTPGVKVVIDHLCRYSQGTPAEYEEVLKLGASPGVYMKFSGLSYSSKQPPPHADLQPLCRRIHQAFGAEKIVWGGLGKNAPDYEKQNRSFETVWSFLSPADRQRIRHGNAAKLYHLG